MNITDADLEAAHEVLDWMVDDVKSRVLYADDIWEALTHTITEVGDMHVALTLLTVALQRLARQ